MSKQVAALEARLGAKLLVRSTRAIALTRAGEVFFPEARRVSEEVEAAEAMARANERTLEGALKIASSVGFGAGRLMPAVRSFLATHPALSIDLKLEDAFVDLVAEGVDVAVRIGELPDAPRLRSSPTSNSGAKPIPSARLISTCPVISSLNNTSKTHSKSLAIE